MSECMGTDSRAGMVEIVAVFEVYFKHYTLPALDRSVPIG
jgi:hypothetical protein